MGATCSVDTSVSEVQVKKDVEYKPYIFEDSIDIAKRNKRLKRMKSIQSDTARSLESVFEDTISDRKTK